MLEITELMHLADAQTLTQLLELVQTSAEQNPFWNGGVAQWEWHPDSEASGSQCG